MLRALTEGLSTPEICERLFITPNTLRTHVQNIMGKLHVHSKLEAVAFASATAWWSRRARSSPLTEPAGLPRRRTLVSPAATGRRRRPGAGAGDAPRPAARRSPAAGPAREGVHPPDPVAALVEPPVGVEERAAARAAPLLGEQRVERGGRVDLAAAGAAGELGHGPATRAQGGGGPRTDPRRLRHVTDATPTHGPDNARGAPPRRPGHTGRWPRWVALFP